MVTETSTEYKEVKDDADFTGFGSGLDSKFNSIPQRDSSFKPSSSQFALPSKSTFPESSISTKSPSSSDDDEGDTFEEDALKKHNEYRRKHGCSSLKLDKKVPHLHLRM